MSSTSDSWERLTESLLWSALQNTFRDIATWGEGRAEEAVRRLSAGQQLMASPLIAVNAVDAETLTFYVRGTFDLFPGVKSAFLRGEVRISKDLDFTFAHTPLTVIEWTTAAIDVNLGWDNVFDANIAVGYDRGAWLGRGRLSIIPAHFAIDILVGVNPGRGLLIGLDVDFPTAVPLGPTGVGLKGIGGEFAYNFVARLEEAGLEIRNPTARDYVRWAQLPSSAAISRWRTGPMDQTAIGVGIHCDLVTLPDNGFSVHLEAIGLTVLVPGPVFVLGGTGKFLRLQSARIGGFLAIDIASASLSLGLGVRIKIPPRGRYSLLDMGGNFEAFFSFRDPSLWYVNVGTESEPLLAGVIVPEHPEGMEYSARTSRNAQIFLMLNNNRIHFGGGVFFGGEWRFAFIELIAKLGVYLSVLIGWNPVELEGRFRIYGELGLKIWIFKLIIRASAEAIGHTPRPMRLELILLLSIELTWPIPSLTLRQPFSISDVQPPVLTSPLLTGVSESGGTETRGQQQMGAVHPLSGRQWSLNSDNIWPDAEIVIPFSRQVTDRTTMVVGRVVSPETQGGYEVRHELTQLELRDLVTEELVPDVRAVWAIGPSGNTARLHVLSHDPFAWLIPHPDAEVSAMETPGRVVEQRFGTAAPFFFSDERRFGEMLVQPTGEAQLIHVFRPGLPSRVLQARQFRLRFQTVYGATIPVTSLTLFIIASRQRAGLSSSAGSGNVLGSVRPVHGELYLIGVSVPLSGPTEEVTIVSTEPGALLVYSVWYQEARRIKNEWRERVILRPGRYRIRVAGGSTATSASGLPPATPVNWRDEQEFGVQYPESLRPYVQYATIGDTRLFQPEPEPWNPTSEGIGFPIYRRYRGVIRFRTWYMSRIFPSLRVQLQYEGGGELEWDIAPAPNSEGAATVSDTARTWIAEAGGRVLPDEEILLPADLPHAGAATITITFRGPGDTTAMLDRWTCFVSRFESFRHHMSWGRVSIQTFYSAEGKNVRPACRTLIAPRRTGGAGNRMGDVVEAISTPTLADEMAIGPLFESPTSMDPPPVELSLAPPDWRLPNGLVAWLRSLDRETGVRFAQFARETGCRFNDGAGDPLDTIQDTVSETTVEAVVDDFGRPVALWLRTPEPVDWRRVTGMLQIQHVEQSGNCPSGYANRTPLLLDLDFLPGPDGSSAFLVGRFHDVPVVLPRGECVISLMFDPAARNLPRLRPALPGTEHAELRFVQPSGEDWPLPWWLSGIDYGVLEDIVRLNPELIMRISGKRRSGENSGSGDKKGGK